MDNPPKTKPYHSPVSNSHYFFIVRQPPSKIPNSCTIYQPFDKIDFSNQKYKGGKCPIKRSPISKRGIWWGSWKIHLPSWREVCRRMEEW